ncbi:MAG: hypothetical protein IT373_31455 [Polyangiaceae bacterium]|nr:hypothetical protein [Polyangiaceae bacterium]
MPDARTIDDLDKDDDNDTTAAGMTRRLGKVSRILERANARLDAITAGWAQPPEPDKPTVRAALADVQTKAASAVSKTTTLIGRIDATNPV